MKPLQITTSRGAVFNVTFSPALGVERARVHFYDAKADFQTYGPLGQFLGSFYAATIIAWSKAESFAIVRGMPDLELTAEELKPVVDAALKLIEQ